MTNRDGLALWFPDPESLPPDRRSLGIIPGDVGVLTDSGMGFGYLFNIFSDQELIRNVDAPGETAFDPLQALPVQNPVQALPKEMGSIVISASEHRMPYNPDYP